MLGIDPGPSHTGWAVLHGNETKKVGEHKGETFVDHLQTLLQEEQIQVVILEGYIVRPKFKGGYTKVPTLELIGAIKRECRRAGIPLHEQQPAIKPVGYGYAGMVYVKGKSGMHIFDAVAHAMYYWVKECGGRPR